MSETLAMPVQMPSARTRRAKPWEGGRHAWQWGYCATEGCKTPGLQALRLSCCAFCREDLTPALLCVCGESIHPAEAIAQLQHTGVPKLCNLCQRDLDAVYLGRLMSANAIALVNVVAQDASLLPVSFS